ncbi:MAG: carbohydrate kinase [Alphaproteobacteria bacterium]|nr:carbohydrate kinase [Alphaproteobacteria bacterium]MBU1563321.1 carbohydrate kinase [Alphaproteobacteria bacterium]MBU2302044.1 carbohydrate kinase [Alphaproteobacteria bacterium]MBU2367300.1 carbohydrate kinase [Alphaproteobacteria bacterium]
MPLPRHIAVIDIGKTNAKVVLIDSTTRQQVAARGTPNTVLREGLYPHADVERLWGFILESLRALQAEHGVDGISITTHGATAALMAGEELAMPVLDYEHDGPEARAAEYGAARPDFAETLSPRLPNGLNLGAQIFWQAQAHAAAFARVTAILTYPQYWAWRLTGVMASEVTSLGCHTDLWAPGRGDFSSMVRAQGWVETFPPVRPAASVLGSIVPAVATATGLGAETPVTCGIHDSNASLLPHLGAHATPFSIISTGTWTIAMTVGGDTGQLDPARDSLANVDAHGRAVPTARFMGGREFDALVPEIRTPSGADIARVIERDIRVQPSFTPGVGPFPQAAGRWTVDPAQLTAEERTAAASLYLALLTRASLELCGLGREIIIEGPLARNDLFAQALARLAGVRVSASGDATGTSLGASMLFGAGEGVAAAGTAVSPLDVPGFDAYAERWREQIA